MKTKIKESKHLNILGNDNSLSNREILTTYLKRFRWRLGYFSMFAAFPAIMTSFAQEAQAEETKKPETSVGGQNVRLLERLNKNRKLPEFLQTRSNYRLPFEKGGNNIVSELTGGGDNCPGNPIPAGNYTAAAPFTDSGDTTGANNTVGLLDGGYYYNNYLAGGPDHIYSFRLTGFGANPQIQVSATSATYRPMIYVLREAPFQGCPGGTNNFVYWTYYPSNSPAPGGTATISLFDSQLNTPLYLFIDSPTSGANDAGSYTVRMQDVTISPAVPVARRTKFDFDGDSKADISVFRPSDRTWYLHRSTQGGFTATQFGLPNDKLTPADYDDDGKTDIAVYREGVWYRMNSSNQTIEIVPFGLADDIPVPADYTGDGRAEIAVYRNGVWWIRNLVNNQESVIHFGLPTDKPVIGDYDGDGKTDQAVYRDGEWHVNRSSLGYTVTQWGLATDEPVPADYNGDDRTDMTVYRDGTWYILRSTEGNYAVQWGVATDIPAPADYDGDGNADLAVFRDGVWHILRSTSGISTQQFGLPNDKPVPAAYLP